MARPREFNVDTVLESAMQVFWAKGCESTLVDDLCEATGLGRSSLCAALLRPISFLLIMDWTVYNDPYIAAKGDSLHDIYFWTTPNGYKILLFTEEAEMSQQSSTGDSDEPSRETRSAPEAVAH